ncbi:hypothetical protein Aca07nite_12080 [Actinoplanes capillaceus]|uniref:Uncharacterized protein n=1 Tax=Actinoplanes campanulatus TaxID=113559 RepID=A0ABQ3WEP3_9ACTN|nr:hypothetical protein Aca07nite_12080 [Actinoplanes capillaceus]
MLEPAKEQMNCASAKAISAFRNPAGNRAALDFSWVMGPSLLGRDRTGILPNA